MTCALRSTVHSSTEYSTQYTVYSTGYLKQREKESRATNCGHNIPKASSSILIANQALVTI